MMQPRDVIVVGASAGGVEALADLARGLPPDFPAAVFVVLHLPAEANSNLPSILERAGPLPAVHPEDGAPIYPGRIYVAPPNHHLLVDGSQIHLSVGPRVNNVRPSIDVLFRSAARVFGERVVGVVLSGMLDDGTLGLDAIKLRGGIVIIQDPGEARFSGMPRSALERVRADYVLPVAEIPPVLARLVGKPAVASSDPVGRPVRRAQAYQDANGPHATQSEEERSSAVANEFSPIPASDDAAPPPHEKRGNVASGFTCPNCHGSVWELDDGGLPRIECRVGHAFSVDAFLGEQAVALEDAIWSAINALEERAMALRRFAGRFRPQAERTHRYLEQAGAMEQQASLLRDGLARVIQMESGEPPAAKDRATG